MSFGMARGSAGKRGHPNRPRRQGTALVRTQLARLCACPRTHAHRSVDAAASTGTQTSIGTLLSGRAVRPVARYRSRADWDKQLPSLRDRGADRFQRGGCRAVLRSEEHTSELQSLMRIPYAVFCLKKKKTI